MRALSAAFPSAAAAEVAAERLRTDGVPVLDALTPFPVPGLMDAVGRGRAGVRLPMAVAGFGVALGAIALQYWSAVYAYPYNSGGRPNASWPVFMLVPFEVGILAAAVAGLLAFLLRTGLPRMHHPLFAVPGLARATVDRFVLLVDPLEPGRQPAIARLLLEAGALSVSEVDT